MSSTDDRRDIERNTADIETGRLTHLRDNKAGVDGLAALRDRLHPRVKGVQWKLNVLATFLIVMLLVIAGLLQKQADELEGTLDQMCSQRQLNAEKTNRNWDALAEIERQDTSVTEDTRKARLAAYRDAHLVIPVC